MYTRTTVAQNRKWFTVEPVTTETANQGQAKLHGVTAEIARGDTPN